MTWVFFLHRRVVGSTTLLECSKVSNCHYSIDWRCSAHTGATPEQEGCCIIAGCAPRFLLQITSWSPTLGAKVCHQYFLNSIVLLNTLQLVTGATGLWSQGATAVVYGCSVRALGSGYGETTLLVSLHSSTALWNWVPSGVLPRKRHKLVALNVIFIKKQQPAGGGVSQQHSDKQHTNPSFGSLTHWIWLHK